MYSKESFAIVGYEGRPIRNQFLPAGSSKLAVFLPGFAYSLEAPLFYYSTALLHELGYDLLGIDYRYSENPEFLGHGDAERQQWLEADIQGVFESVADHADYQEVLFVGKSLGTNGMLQIANLELPGRLRRYVWLTPATARGAIVEKLREVALPSLVVVGTKDSYYSAGDMQRLEGLDHVGVKIVEGADHGLEFEDDAIRSSEKLSEILWWIRGFAETR